jgi:hypothetical protein
MGKVFENSRAAHAAARILLYQKDQRGENIRSVLIFSGISQPMNLNIPGFIQSLIAMNLQTHNFKCRSRPSIARIHIAKGHGGAS